MTSNVIPMNAAQPGLAERAVCISVRAGRLGNRKKLDADEIQVDADPDAVSASKELLDSDEWKAVKNLDSDVARYLKRKCLPSMFREGVWLVPVPMIETIDLQLSEYAQRRADLVEAFVAAYPGKVAEARGRLRGLYRDSDYPTVDRVRRAFTFTWQYVALGVPGQLSEISTAMLEREREKAERQWSEAQTEIQKVLRAAMQELVDHMVDRLKPDPKTGKPKVFAGSTIDKLSEFLADFKFRNITNDAQLEGLVARAKELLSGRTAEDIRTSEALRGSVASGLASIKSSLDGLCGPRPARKIRLEKPEVTSAAA